MKNSILKLELQTFIIKMQSNNKSYIFQRPEELKYILENYDLNGIEFIKIFNTTNTKFIRVSKEWLKKWANWNTEASLYLENHYYFKRK
jgi:hypothetical protein